VGSWKTSAPLWGRAPLVYGRGDPGVKPTDRRDARALPEACLLGAYRPAHRLSDAQRHVRGRLAVCDPVVRTRTGYIALTRALLRRHGWRVPTGSATFMRRVVALPLPGRLLSELAPLLAAMRPINQQLAYSDGAIVALTRPDERVQRLRTVPSVGPVTAAAFVAPIDDARRSRRAHEVKAYLGLVPRESARAAVGTLPPREARARGAHRPRARRPAPLPPDLSVVAGGGPGASAPRSRRSTKWGLVPFRRFALVRRAPRGGR